MSTSRDIHESLKKLKVLSGLHDTSPNFHDEKVKEEETNVLVKYKDALENFKSTHQIRDTMIFINYQISEKLYKICALPQMLDSYINTPTIDQAQTICNHCKSILNMHERSDYDPLFKTYTYLDPQGFQRKPKYGVWTYNEHKYEMKKIITDIQDIMEWFILEG